MTSSGRVPTLSFAWEGFLTPERSMAQDRIHVQLTIRVGQLFTLGSIDISPGSHPLAVGNLNNVRLSASQVSKVISILSQHNICCCFVEKFALIYYSANREPNGRVLCVPDKDHESYCAVIYAQYLTNIHVSKLLEGWYQKLWSQS
ncbi:hypothetical protein GX50_03078 [[Emmonsia] crescens]|uniref:Uncharacterized protein n=1 Tax=[Emmonsia] crescens TaxID=73230 RepID=A0A2B7ZKF9_9EURO|nr:hypothetical protein GX50_03078 [Emmonsia crescens]